VIRFFDDGTWTNQVTANTPVSATYKRNIPGYKLKSVLMKNNKIRRFDDASGAGTLEEAASVNTSTNAIRGYMPNDDLTVGYRYEPDTSKKFTLRVEYVDGSGTAIKTPDAYAYSAETAFSVAPASITAYELTDAELKAGYGDTDDLVNRGIYSAASAGCSFDADKNYAGKMPNQMVVITYKYQIDPSYTTHVIVNTVDNHNNILEQQKNLSVSPADPVELDIERKPGYSYPPNITWSGNFTNYVLDQSSEKLTFHTDIIGGSVNITYNEDLTDPDYWARIDYYNGANGSLSGDSSPKSFRLDTYTIDELTQGITPSPAIHYLFEG